MPPQLPVHTPTLCGVAIILVVVLGGLVYLTGPILIATLKEAYWLWWELFNE